MTDFGILDLTQIVAIGIMTFAGLYSVMLGFKMSRSKLDKN